MEFLLDEAGWKDEAAGVIKDISSYVTSVAVAESLPCSNSQIFLNLVTKENKNFTVALNPEGFKIVGFGLDTIDTDGYDDSVNYSNIYPIFISQGNYLRDSLFPSGQHQSRLQGGVWKSPDRRTLEASETPG